jgi:hypothetical protein
MHSKSKRFGLELSNTPLINLRMEFNEHHELLSDPTFRAQFAPGEIIRPVQTPYMIWAGMPAAFLTLITQRAFTGIEASVIGATNIALGGRSVTALQAAHEKLANPFLLGGRGVVENYYHLAPSLASPDYSLKRHNSKLWERTKHLYKEIRNPLFHGYEIVADHIDGVFDVFEHLGDMYRWIDSWCDPNALMPWFRGSLAPRPRSAT